MKWKVVRFGAGSLAAALLSVQSNGAEAQQFHGLTVGTYAPCDFGCTPFPPVTVSAAEIDNMFNAATNILRDDVDGAGDADQFCDVSLFRQQEVEPFMAGDGDVDSNEDFWNVSEYGSSYGHTNFVKIVRSITYCGRTGFFEGCAPIGPRNSVVITEGAVRSAGAGFVLAHEVGHSVSLGHQDGSPENIMYPYVLSSAHGVWPWQCSAYNAPVDGDGPGYNPFTPRGPMDATAKFPQDDHPRMDFSGVSIEEAAHRTYVDLVPAEVADYYGDEDVAVLTRMLHDPREADHHAKIAQLIGLIASGRDTRHTSALLELVKSRAAARDAHASATISLGYLAHRGDHAAFSFLAHHARDIKSPVVAWAIQALGLSGREDARAELSRLERDADDDEKSARPGRARRLFRQALRDNDDVRGRGLRAYYGR